MRYAALPGQQQFRTASGICLGCLQQPEHGATRWLWDLLPATLKSEPAAEFTGGPVLCPTVGDEPRYAAAESASRCAGEWTGSEQFHSHCVVVHWYQREWRPERHVYSELHRDDHLQQSYVHELCRATLRQLRRKRHELLDQFGVILGGAAGCACSLQPAMEPHVA